MKTANQVPVNLEVLQERLRELEHKVLNNEELLQQQREATTQQRKPFTRQVPEESQLLFRLEQLQNRYNSLENVYVKDMLKKYREAQCIDELESFVEDHKSEEREDVLMFKAEKMKYIMDEEPEVDKLCHQFAQLENLIPFIQSELHQEVAQININQVMPLARKHDEEEVEVVVRSQRIHSLLHQYNQVVSLLSQKFVYWDKLLTALEKDVNQKQ